MIGRNETSIILLHSFPLDIKAIPIPAYFLEDRVCLSFSSDGRFSLKFVT